MILQKGFRSSFKVKSVFGTMKCTAFCGPMRLRLALLMCIVFTCSVSLFAFHYLLVTFGDCLAFNFNTYSPSPDPDNLVRSPHWDYFDRIYVLHSSAATERAPHIHAAIKKLHLENDVVWWDAVIDLEHGHRGVWNSHKSIAQNAIANNYSKILVFEDDIQIDPFLKSGVDGVLNRVVHFLRATPSWEAFFFSHNCKRMELTSNPEFVRVNSWSTVAFALQGKGLTTLADSNWKDGETVDSLLFYNQNTYAMYPYVIEHKPNLSYTTKENRTEDVNKLWRYEERILHEDALERNMYACSSPSRRAWGQLLYNPPRL